MPLHQSNPAPERILAFGPAGSGKTTNWLHVAKLAALTRSPARFFVLDTDFAVARMLVGYPQLQDRIILYSCFDWTDYTAAQADIARQATADDWVIIDFIGTAWSAVQEYYVDQVFHQDIGNYFLQARKELKKSDTSLGALEGWTDWGVINPLYKKWANNILFRGRYNVYATAKTDNLSSEKKPTEDKQTRQLFLPYGVKPVGQKDLPYSFHTLLLTARTGNANERTITTVKDRERQEVAGLPITNFANDYLVNIGGWKLA